MYAKRPTELPLASRHASGFQAPAALIPEPILDACSLASLQMRGPTLRSLAITSAVRGEGRSTIAMAMALVQHQDYKRSAILVELDLDKPSLARRFGLAPVPGIAELVRGEASLSDAIQWLDGIKVLTAGAPSGRADRIAIDLVGSSLLQEAGKNYDVVVADLPPLGGCSYARILLQGFDRLVLVMLAGVTPVNAIREAITDLPAEPVVIMNGAPDAAARPPKRGQR